METKLFCGTPLTSGLRSEIGSRSIEPLLCIPYEGKEFVGLYLTRQRPTLSDIHEATDYVFSSLQTHCPSLRCDTLPLAIFPQAFLG